MTMELHHSRLLLFDFIPDFYIEFFRVQSDLKPLNKASFVGRNLIYIKKNWKNFKVLGISRNRSPFYISLETDLTYSFLNGRWSLSS